jgi:hypothetical protein
MTELAVPAVRESLVAEPVDARYSTQQQHDTPDSRRGPGNIGWGWLW